MTDELIDIFDENNNPTGQQEMKSKAHKTGLWHRGAHIWIYNSKREILLQLRAKEKKMYPDKWDVSAAGHVSAGEDPAITGIRELYEELGIKADKEDLYFFMIRKSRDSYKEKIDNEFYYVYLLKYEGDASSLNLQETEVQDVKFIDIDSLEEELKKNPTNFVQYGPYWLDVIEEVREILNQK